MTRIESYYPNDPGTSNHKDSRINPPAISVMFVAGLAHPDFLAEIDETSVVPE
ncbi:MAG TPA: hypothetical protein VJ785_00730 [Anaerolineales bacterium]|nr:hypothetical protein [Anaerolineales bacterium]